MCFKGAEKKSCAIMRILNVTESYAPFYEFGGPPAKVEALFARACRARGTA